MAKESAGILVYKNVNEELMVLLAHNGGPFFKNKDEGWWTIPKGLINEGEDKLSAAKREFKEETGQTAPEGDYISLGSVKQANNKIVYCWAIEADIDVRSIKSNTFDLEWPPKSGIVKQFPEIDKAEWFNVARAKTKANKAQGELIETLVELLK
jgi:predicted NUDIX family NTP pyrophosphohydrolase